MSELSILIKHDISKNTYEIATEIKRSMLKDILGDVVRSKLGAGVDNSTPNRLAIYQIKILIDISVDLISTSSNCGNKGLETGIIMDAFQRMDEKGIIR